MIQRPPRPPPFPYPTLFRSCTDRMDRRRHRDDGGARRPCPPAPDAGPARHSADPQEGKGDERRQDRKSTRLNSSHRGISYAVFCLKKKKDDMKDVVSVCEEH